MEIRSELDKENRLWLFMDVKEEHEYFDEVCERIIRNPRFYLDNLDYLHTFRVGWIPYKKESEGVKHKKQKSKDL
jgi:hypothetical protein